MQKPLTILKALSDRNRLRIVAALRKQTELCACQITEMLQVTGATVSRHMGILVQAGLVESRKVGRWIFFWLKDSPDVDSQAILIWLEESLKKSPEIENDRRELGAILAVGKEDLCRRQRGEACCPRPD